MNDLNLTAADETLLRQQRYMAAAAATLRAQRQQRRNWLAEHSDGIRRATALYEQLDRGSVPDIALRDAFVRLQSARPHLDDPVADQTGEQPRGAAARLKADKLSRPPVTQLTIRRNNALALYLSAIYVAHLEYQPRVQVNNGRSTANGPTSWAVLSGIGLGPNYRARKARATRALDILYAAHLVDLPRRDHHRDYEHWQLLREDGSEHPYTVPTHTKERAVGACLVLLPWLASRARTQ